MDNVISIFRPTKKEIAKWFTKNSVPIPEPPLKLDPGFRDESDRYSGKLREAMKKYGSFKGNKR
jgi:hypothetical protein